MKNKTDYAAWLGAITGSLALIFQMYTWVFDGPRLDITVTTNRNLNVGDQLIGQGVVIAEVSNNGRGSCTITDIGYKIIDYSGNTIQDKIAVESGITDPLPKKLAPGDFWVGSFKQSEELEQYIKSGNAYFTLRCSNKSEPYMVPMVITHSRQLHPTQKAHG